MGSIKGFLRTERDLPKTEDAQSRIEHFKEFYIPLPIAHTEEQASRCMDCGVPFCMSGCPLGNLIPDFNDAVYMNEWKEAYRILSETNNFPEFTGRICPAPCESACVLGINKNPVTIEYIEKRIIEEAFEKKWVTPIVPKQITGKKVAIVGSGPAGMACAEQLTKAGHQVHVFEKSDRIGGLLRYGIPDFKLEKTVLDRRIELMKAAGIQFSTGINVGEDITAKELKAEYDSIVLCGGSSVARDLNIPGRISKGIYPAMQFLTQNNQLVAGDRIPENELINVKGKDVIVIGGGDTGSDCIGTSNRLGANSITQIEIMSKPSNSRGLNDPWPNWPMTLRTSTSHEEGCHREWSILTKRFISEDGFHISGIEIVHILWDKDEQGNYKMKELEHTKRILPCSTVFLAMGFLHPQKEGLLEQLGVELDERGNVATKNYGTSVPDVFAAGDMRRGQSLVVWAISEGREAAKVVDEYLMGSVSALPSKELSSLSL
ncbi:MAG: glutamate synthase subunit beta [Saprospiraceae bacterium]|nr:glutamate synthase subunit beta [Saprospiraceae bacterium]